MIDISKLSKLELKQLLKKLSLLNSLKKALGNRANREYERINNKVDFYKIEYYDSEETSLAYVKEKSSICFNELFGLNVKTEEIQFISNKNLKGGIRIFFNDNMFDLSYSRFEKLLK